MQTIKHANGDNPRFKIYMHAPYDK